MSILLGIITLPFSPLVRVDSILGLWAIHLLVLKAESGASSLLKHGTQAGQVIC